jgi:Ca-activated chloride channel homolog
VKYKVVSLSLTLALLFGAACSTPPEPRPEPQVLGQGTVPPPRERDEEKLRDQAASQPATVPMKAEPLAARESQQAIGKLAYAPPFCCTRPLPEDRENYAKIDGNPVQRVAEQPVSTFSVDVDTGSYANVRRFLQQGSLPPQDAVRVEELINYFDYAYAAPRDAGTPFSVVTEIAPTPWNAKTHLLHIGIQGWKPTGPRKPSNLVFLVDVSGSMQDAAKLPLVKSALKLLTRQLTRKDRISLVVYAGSSGVVLEPTPGSESAKIEAALDRLEAGGPTHGSAGIQTAYALARQAFIEGGNNRVLLATDGDFNVGVTRFESLLDLVKEQRKSGVALTTLGFGAGNYNDHLMEQLADAGDGNHAYIDTLSEAQKVLVDQRDATLQIIARDVKIQIEFNPALVAEYRLIGYENRLLAREDFNNDQVDAGDIGARHTVTALYEIALAGSGGERIAPLRYGAAASPKKAGEELAYVRLRYKRPDDGMQAASRLIEKPLLRSQIASATSESWRLAAAVAAFGQVLRGGQYTESFRYTEIEQLLRSARGADRNGYTGEFLQLVKLADILSTQARAPENSD